MRATRKISTIDATTMLTDKLLKSKNGKEQEKEHFIAHQNGLYARIRKAGSITFVYRYRYNKKQRKIVIGKYPALSIKDAAEQVAVYAKQLEQGKDPAIERKIAKLKTDEALTVKEAYLKWWRFKYANHPRFDDEIRGAPHQAKRLAELYIFPAIGDLPWDRTEKSHWSNILTELSIKKPATARTLITLIKSAEAHLNTAGYISSSVLQLFSPKTFNIKKRKGTRVLSDIEIKEFWQQLDTMRMMPKYKILLKLLLIYGCRTKELRLAEAKHFDFNRMIWTVPEHLTKPKELLKDGFDSRVKSIKRPIIPETVAMLRHAMTLSGSEQYLFTVRKTNKPLSESAMLDITGRIVDKINERVSWHFEYFSKHDLRRTMRTRMSKIAPYHIAEKMLGHVLPSVHGVYDHYDYLDEMRDHYQTWYNQLMKIIKTDTVVQLQIAN